MLYHPELIVYLWLMPVLSLIVLPFLFKAGCTLYRLTPWGRTFFKEYSTGDNLVASQERRRYPRAEIGGAVVRVAGTDECCAANVSNISKLGICLRNLPQALLAEAEKLNVIVNTQAGNFTMLVKPIWQRSHDSGYLVGAEVDRVYSNR